MVGMPTKPAISYRVLIVEDESLVGFALRKDLEALGHRPIAPIAKASNAQELFRQEIPDLVLMDIRLNGEDGIELAKELIKQRPCPIVVVSAYSERDLIERATAAGVYGYLLKPVSPPLLEAQIEIAVARFADEQKLVAEKDALAQSLETRKLVEKAKGILMRRQGLSEQDAHQRLQHDSQKRRQSLPELCRKIIEAESLLGG